MRRYILIALCSLLFVWSAHPVQASSVFAGTGQSVSTTPAIATMATAAANEAKAAYAASGGSASPPKVILIMENTGDGSGALVSSIRSVFGTSVPILGIQEAWSDYTPYTLKEIPALATQLTISVLALGGDAINVNWATGIGNFNANDNSQAQIGGQNLASKLTPVAGKNNLILLMGPLHTPLNEYAVAGMKQVYGSPLPANIKMIGWSGSYWGDQVFDGGTLKSNQILGIQLSGDFKWAFSGINYGTSGWNGLGAGDPVVEIPKHFQNVITQLGGVPAVSFMVIAHPGRSNFAAIRDGIATKIGTKAMIGMNGGSETGHDTTTGDVIPDADHFFLAGITGNSAPVPTPAPTPTAVPVCVGDIDGNRFVDISDYSILVQNLFLAVLKNPRADLTGEGIVDISDYSVLVQHFFIPCP